MSNHFHLIAVPAHEGAAAKALGRLEADYARFLKITRVELLEATLSGHPLGQALVERLEKELNKRLCRGKAGRPPKQRADSAQGALFSNTG